MTQSLQVKRYDEYYIFAITDYKVKHRIPKDSNLKEYLYEYLEGILDDYPVDVDLWIGLLRFDLDLDRILRDDKSVILIHCKSLNSEKDTIWNKFPYFIHTTNKQSEND